ncbi:glucose-6-phosphate dehydrogenase [Tomitella gaofuii]|uniref:glucose-6-phosphate dehydrogenase n=1 Tax=Tomitella gaofuii TaxID=2760083 RepID=UPI001F296DC0|nr:glucose-6-phosphate dehydrogenase [Tomitella gaofuii]
MRSPLTGAAPVTAHNPLRDPRDRRLPRIAGPCSLVIFGVTGDLARKKLLPSVYDLAAAGLLPPGFGLVGFGRREWSDDEFRQFVLDSIEGRTRAPFKRAVWERLAEGIRFVGGAFDEDAAYGRLAESLAGLDAERGTAGNYAFYLAIPPAAFPPVCAHLDAHGLAQERVLRPAEQGGDGSERDGAPGGAGLLAGGRPDGTSPGERDHWRRVVIEKPFGHDLESARALNGAITEVFDERNVFRIDHYLGKETVQNILALRFANQLFDPLWNSHYVDHVQITMAEDIGLGGRAGYYDGIGAARDVIQNHLLQLLALTAMEEPVSFEPRAIQAEKIKVLSATRLAAPLSETTARGQYARGWQGSEQVCGLQEEKGFAEGSTTETFAAITLEVDSRRWAGVPFYLRTGKRLGRRVTEIAVVFTRAPHLPFDTTMTEELGQNALVIRVQPDEGITVRFGSKVPGSSMEVRDVNMDFSYGQAFTVSSPEAYERLILDVLLGEPSLFPVGEEVELSWAILEPVLEAWAAGGAPEPYESGGWGPSSADAMLRRSGREWRRP